MSFGKQMIKKVCIKTIILSRFFNRDYKFFINMNLSIAYLNGFLLMIKKFFHNNYKKYDLNQVFLKETLSIILF